MIYTTSMYPSAPSPIPGPGVINWSGYIVPGAGPSLDADGNVIGSTADVVSDWQPIGDSSNDINNQSSNPFNYFYLYFLPSVLFLHNLKAQLLYLQKLMT